MTLLLHVREPPIHWDAITLDTAIHHCYIDTPVYMHWLSMYSCYMDHGLYYCSWIFLYSRYYMTYCYMS